MTIPVYNQKGQDVGKVRLRPEVFDVKINSVLVHQVAVSMMANARGPYAHVKTRGEVSGGGKKPWRQKGTGRARHGSIRSPLWVGGGVTFGPRNDRNFKKKINKKVKTKAILMCLTDKAKSEKLIVLDNLKLDIPKTKFFFQICKKLPIEGKVMFVLPDKDEFLKRSSRNLPDVLLKTVGNFNILDLLNSKFLILTKESIKKLEEKYIFDKETKKQRNKETKK